MKEFSNWLKEELNSRDLKPADIARTSNITEATLSRILNQYRQAGTEACKAIAHALNLPEEEVFRKAGLLPPALPKTNELTGLNKEIFNELQTVEDDFKTALLKTIKTWKLLYEELKQKQ